MMKGWKTWLATAIAVVAAGLHVVPGMGVWSEPLMMLAGALGLVGIGHKIEKKK